MSQTTTATLQYREMSGSRSNGDATLSGSNNANNRPRPVGPATPLRHAGLRAGGVDSVLVGGQGLHVRAQPPSAIRRDRAGVASSARHRRSNNGRQFDGGACASSSSPTQEENDAPLPTKSLSQTLAEMSAQASQQQQWHGTYHAQSMPSRTTGWETPDVGTTRSNRSGPGSGTGFAKDDDLRVLLDDDQDFSSNLSVSSADSSFSANLGPIAVPLDTVANFLYQRLNFDLRAYLARRRWNARTIRGAAALWFPRFLAALFAFFVLKSIFWYSAMHGTTTSRPNGDNGNQSDSTYKMGKLQTGFGPPQPLSDSGVRGSFRSPPLPSVVKSEGTKAVFAPLVPSAAATTNADADAGGPTNLADGGKTKKKKKQHKKLPIPAGLSNLSDLNVPYDAGTETPYFWDVHFSGETIAERVFAKCHGLVQAAEHGLQQPEFTEDRLGVFEIDGNKYVNVDLSMEAGISRAKRLDLAGMRLADVVISPDLQQAANVFTDRNKGRMFAIFRHPVDRAVSMYFYLSTATWDPMYNPKLKDMNLEEYARSSSVENNWLTRFLVGKKSGALNPGHMVLAKKIVRNKILVGLYNDMETSLSRFDRYFGWTDRANEKAGGRQAEEIDEQAKKCRKAFIEAGDNRHDHPVVEPGSKEWDLIVRQNKYDMELYEYIKKLYKTQAEQIFGVI